MPEEKVSDKGNRKTKVQNKSTVNRVGFVSMVRFKKKTTTGKGIPH